MCLMKRNFHFVLLVVAPTNKSGMNTILSVNKDLDPAHVLICFKKQFKERIFIFIFNNISLS